MLFYLIESCQWIQWMVFRRTAPPHLLVHEKAETPSQGFPWWIGGQPQFMMSWRLKMPVLWISLPLSLIFNDLFQFATLNLNGCLEAKGIKRTCPVISDYESLSFTIPLRQNMAWWKTPIYRVRWLPLIPHLALWFSHEPSFSLTMHDFAMNLPSKSMIFPLKCPCRLQGIPSYVWHPACHGRPGS